MAEDFPEFYFSTRRDELVSSPLLLPFVAVCVFNVHKFYYIRRPAEELSLGKFMTMER